MLMQFPWKSIPYIDKLKYQIQLSTVYAILPLSTLLRLFHCFDRLYIIAFMGLNMLSLILLQKCLECKYSYLVKASVQFISSQFTIILQQK